MRNFVGILGAVFGHTLLNAMHIRTKAARGLAMGTASHALGTARCAELDYREGAFSSPGAGDLRHYYLAGSTLFVSAHSGGNALTTDKDRVKICDTSRIFI